MKTSALDIEEIMSKPEGSKCVCSESVLFRNPQVCASYMAGGWLAEKCCDCGHSRACHAPKIHEGESNG